MYKVLYGPQVRRWISSFKNTRHIPVVIKRNTFIKELKVYNKLKENKQ